MAQSYLCGMLFQEHLHQSLESVRSRRHCGWITLCGGGSGPHQPFRTPQDTHKVDHMTLKAHAAATALVLPGNASWGHAPLGDMVLLLCSMVGCDPPFQEYWYTRLCCTFCPRGISTTCYLRLLPIIHPGLYSLKYKYVFWATNHSLLLTLFKGTTRATNI